MAEASGISMAPHACEGPIGGIATLHVDAAMPNFLVQEICGGVEPRHEGEGLGGVARLPRHAHGQRALSRCPISPAWASNLTEAALEKYPFGGTRRWRACFTPMAPSRNGKALARYRPYGNRPVTARIENVCLASAVFAHES